MRLNLHYRTSYRYSQPARKVIQLLRLTPLSFVGQTVLDWRIDVDCDARLREGRDGYGNVTHMLYIDRPVTNLTVTATGKVLTEDRAGVIAQVPGDLPPEVFLRQTPLTNPSAAIGELAAALAADEGSPLDRLHLLNTQIHERMNFNTSGTETNTTATEAWLAGQGVCQDFSHIFLSVARVMGIPARYVSGHLYRRDGQVMQEAGHAWVECWLDDLGWVAFDPSNGISPDDAYIRVAAGLDYRDAAPFSGARSGGGTEELSVEVQVRLAQGQFQFQSQQPGTQVQSQSRN